MVRGLPCPIIQSALPTYPKVVIQPSPPSPHGDRGRASLLPRHGQHLPRINLRSGSEEAHLSAPRPAGQSTSGEGKWAAVVSGESSQGAGPHVKGRGSGSPGRAPSFQSPRDVVARVAPGAAGGSGLPPGQAGLRPGPPAHLPGVRCPCFCASGKRVMQPQLLEVNFNPDCERACRFHPTFFNDVFSTLYLDEPDSCPVTRLV